MSRKEAQVDLVRVWVEEESKESEAERVVSNMNSAEEYMFEQDLDHSLDR